MHNYENRSVHMEILLEIQVGHPPIVFADLIFREFLYFMYVVYSPQGKTTARQQHVSEVRNSELEGLQNAISKKCYIILYKAGVKSITIGDLILLYFVCVWEFCTCVSNKKCVHSSQIMVETAYGIGNVSK